MNTPVSAAKCPECEGEGLVDPPPNTEFIVSICPTCSGTGEVQP